MSAAPPSRLATEEQRQAISSRGEDAFLQAGAGTGKTGVLVDRYCGAVAEDGIAPERILAFTFTEKAAAELRRRVRAELERRARSGPEAAAWLREAVRQLGAAPITTIHGFCRRLLGSHPVAAGLDPRFRVLDAPEARRVAWSAFDDALEDLGEGKSGEHEDAIAAFGVLRARALIIATHEELRSRGVPPLLPSVAPRHLDAALAAVEAAADAARGASGGGAAQDECFETARRLALGRGERMPTLAELEALDPGPGSSVSERSACQRAIRTAVAVAAEREVGLPAYAALAELLRLFAGRYSQAKEARSGLDFEDLQLRAVELLGRSPAIGSTYRQRFLHLLVDEFQDTNGLQLALIDALRGAETRLFVVGDEFQAIYGFRGADIGVFTSEHERFDSTPNARVMRLSGNFRSRPEILAAANEIGAATLTGFRELTAQRAPSGTRQAVELLITEPAGWDGFAETLERAPADPTPVECVAEARALARRLRELVDAGHEQTEIVLLLRAFSHVDAFEAALDRVGLTPYVVGGAGYWSQQQAQDLVALLGAIANPIADEPLLGALASPAGQISPDTLWLLRAAAGRSRSLWTAVLAASGSTGGEPELPERLEAIPDAERARLARFRGLIERLRAAGGRLSLESLVERAVTESGYDLAVLMADHGERRFANVRKMMRLAREFESAEGRDLRAFLDFAAQSAEQDAEAPAAIEAEEGEGVRIMTIHTAKGLEFPIVAVAELGRALQPKSSPDLVLGRSGEDPLRAGLRLPRFGNPTLRLFAHEELVDEATGREEAEELRLAYVAATRARERLLLSGIRHTTEHRDQRSTSVLRRLLGHLGVPAPEAGATIQLPRPRPAPELEGELPDPRLEIRVSVAGEDEARRLAARLPPRLAPAPPPDGTPPLLAEQPPTVPRRPLSYSTLHEHARCGYRFYVERVLGLGANGGRARDSEGLAGDAARQVGNAVHEVLRQSAEKRFGEPGEKALRGALARRGLDPGDERRLEQVRGFARAWLTSSLCDELRAAQARLRAEHPFLIELGGTIVRGSIDLLVESPEALPLLVDYKTDRLDGTEPAQKAAEYAMQRDLYAIAAAQALGADAVEVAYVFLEVPDAPVRSRLGPTELTAARDRLLAAVAAIAGGAFGVTPTPDWPLCRDCPARRRLCPSPATPPPSVPERAA